MTTFTTAFVGCKVSQADCEAAANELAAAGLDWAGSRAADVAVVMTCCVTAEAERKSRQLVGRYARHGARVLAAGCASRLRPEQFRRPGVATFDESRGLGTTEGLAATAAGLAGRTGSARHTSVSQDGGEEAEPTGRTRLLLKLQDGCAQRCSYCAVRLARGAPAGLPLAGALEAARRGVAAGCGEVVLTGVNLGAYRDEVSGADLADAVQALVALPGLRRLRLSSLEPGHLTPKLLAALAHERVARHLHVPLQSADDGVLADMVRPYTFGEYVGLIARARGVLGDVAVTTDVIVGFPTEDEAAFARTLAAIAATADSSVVRSVESWHDPEAGDMPAAGRGLFERVHVFSYSHRPGTPAAALRELPPAVVKERMGRALGAARDAQRAAHLRRLPQLAAVLLEERRDGLWRGYSSQYVRYYLEGEGRRGEVVTACGEEAFADGLRGRIA